MASSTNSIHVSYYDPLNIFKGGDMTIAGSSNAELTTSFYNSRHGNHSGKECTTSSHNLLDDWLENRHLFFDWRNAGAVQLYKKNCDGKYEICYINKKNKEYNSISRPNDLKFSSFSHVERLLMRDLLDDLIPENNTDLKRSSDYVNETVEPKRKKAKLEQSYEDENTKCKQSNEDEKTKQEQSVEDENPEQKQTVEDENPEQEQSVEDENPKQEQSVVYETPKQEQSVVYEKPKQEQSVEDEKTEQEQSVEDKITGRELEILKNLANPEVQAKYKTYLEDNNYILKMWSERPPCRFEYESKISCSQFIENIFPKGSQYGYIVKFVRQPILTKESRKQNKIEEQKACLNAWYNFKKAYSEYNNPLNGK